MKFREDELATEVAWVVVYLSALSNVATCMLVKNDVLQLLVERLATSNSLQLLIPVVRSFVRLSPFVNNLARWLLGASDRFFTL